MSKNNTVKNNTSKTYYYLFLWYELNEKLKRNEDKYALVKSTDDFKSMFSLELRTDFNVWNTKLTNKQFNILTTCNTDISHLYSKYPTLRKFSYDGFDEDIKGDEFDVICIDIRKLTKDCKGNEIKHNYQREFAYVKFVGDNYNNGNKQEIIYTKAYLFGSFAYMFYMKSKCSNLIKKENLNDKIIEDIIKINEYIKTISKENADEIVVNANNYYNEIKKEYDFINSFYINQLPSKQNIDCIESHLKQLKYNVIKLYECKNKISELGEKVENSRFIK